MNAHSYTYEAIGPLHSIYVGSGPTGTISEAERSLIVRLCREAFDSFTFADARGFFKGLEEQSIVIQVATYDRDAIRRLASKIRLTHNQVSVGIGEPDPNAGGIFYGRVRPKE